MYQIEVFTTEEAVNDFLKWQDRDFVLIDIKMTDNRFMIIYKA